MKRLSVYEVCAEVAAGCMKGPMSRADLVRLTGADSQTVETALRAFRASGCIRIVGENRKLRALYQWQPSLFAEPDAKRSGYESMTDAARCSGVPLETLRKRLYRGVPLQEALRR